MATGAGLVAAVSVVSEMLTEDGRINVQSVVGAETIGGGGKP